MPIGGSHTRTLIHNEAKHFWGSVWRSEWESRWRRRCPVPYIAQVCINSRLSILDPESQAHPMIVLISRITSFKSSFPTTPQSTISPPLSIHQHIITPHSTSCSFVNTIDKKTPYWHISIVHPKSPWTKDASGCRDLLCLDASRRLIFCAQMHADSRRRTLADNADACKIFQLHSRSKLLYV